MRTSPLTAMVMPLHRRPDRIHWDAGRSSESGTQLAGLLRMAIRDETSLIVPQASKTSGEAGDLPPDAGGRPDATSAADTRRGAEPTHAATPETSTRRGSSSERDRGGREHE